MYIYIYIYICVYIYISVYTNQAVSFRLLFLRDIAFFREYTGGGRNLFRENRNFKLDKQVSGMRKGIPT